MSLDNATLAATPDGGGSDVGSDAPSLLSRGLVLSEKYRLERPLGRGAMGEVWLAVHERLQTRVAIKLLSCDTSGQPADVAWVAERFEFEAQVSARLAASTRHIVSVHDVSTYEGRPYLVMELVEGHTLEKEIEAASLAPDVVATVLEQVADALAVAHRLGIIHRDIKPSNLMLTRTEAGELLVKVADFGVAKAVRNDLRVSLPKETGLGVFVGSPAYMSPEQLRADGSLDWRSDLWSLAVVAYEALTRAQPFEGRTLPHLMVAISDRPHVPASARAPALPAALDAWFERALAKDPAARFESLAQMVAAFRAASSQALVVERERVSEPVSLRPRPLALSRAKVALGLGLVVFGVALVWLFAGGRGASEGSPALAATSESSAHAPSVVVIAPAPDAPPVVAPDVPFAPASAAPSARAPRLPPTRTTPTAHASAVPSPVASAPAALPSSRAPRKEIDPSEIH